MIGRVGLAVRRDCPLDWANKTKMSAATLFLAIQAATVSAPADYSRARAAVEAAAQAVDEDRVESQRTRWRMEADGGDVLALLSLATLSRETYRYAEADRLYGELLEDGGARGGSGDGITVQAWLGLGLGKLIRWRTDSAAFAFEQVLGQGSRGDPVARAQALLGLAAIATRTSSADSARALAERASTSIGTNARDVDAARIRCGQAAAIRGAAVLRADSLVTSALERARASGDARTIGRCLIVRAQVLEIRGRQADSRAAIDSALVVLRTTGDQLGLAVALQFSAYAATTYSINLRGGLRDAQDGASIARAAGDELTAGWATLVLAQVASRVGDAATAARHALEARAIFERTNDRLGLATTDIVDAGANLAMGRFGAARDGLLRAYARNDSIGWRTSHPYVLFALSATARGAGDLDGAEQWLDRAMAESRQLGMRGWEVDEKYVRGLNALARGDYSAAIHWFEAYLVAMSSWSRHYLLEGELRLAEAHARAGDLAAAERRLERAFLHIDYVRNLQQDRDASVAALQSRRLDADPDLGIATVVHLLATNGRVESAFRIAEAERARFLWTQLVRRRALGPEPVGSTEQPETRLMPDGLDPQTLRAAIPDSTALVEFATGAGGEPSTAFLVTREGLRAFDLAPADSLTGAIRRFATALEGGVGADGLARRLGEAVLDEVLAEVPANITRLVLSPDGPLHRLPFDALVMADGRRVIERFATSLMPSARLALAMWQAREQRVPRTGAVVVGDAMFGPAFGLPPLPSSRIEARAVARALREPRLLLGTDATEVALRAIDWSGIGLLHLATHARVEDDGILASALYVGATDSMDGRIGVADIAALPLELDLVVLSACRTLGGVVVAGEGLQGLTAPFLEAGARAVVATYWPVGDRSIQPLIARFYSELRAGGSAGDALWKAKRTSFEDGESPAVWAAFSLSGNAAVRPAVF